jgi:CheY-like chemotaxis protein
VADMKAGSAHKILCVEDDRETAALIVEDLIDRGYEVVLARDGREGLEAMLSNTPDLVLADITMPAMSGFERLSMSVSFCAAPTTSRDAATRSVD